MIVHAGLLALWTDGEWRGVLVEGPSGVGKSDLALRAVDAGFRLVSDDRTRLFVSCGRLFGQAPAPLFGLLEVRGVGVVRQCALGYAEVRLVARCVPTSGDVERMPEMKIETRAGLATPVLEIWPLEGSAPAKLRRAIQHLGRRRPRAYQASPAHGRACAET